MAIETKLDQLSTITTPRFPTGAGKLALEILIEWMEQHSLDTIYVQDDAKAPSYGYPPEEFQDEWDRLDMDQTITWLPRGSWENSTPDGGWNPVVRIATLRERLAKEISE